MRLFRRPGRSSFFGRAGASLLMRAGGLALQFGSSIVVGRLLGVEGFGVYAYAFSVSTLLGALLSLGLTPLAVREIPRAVAQGAWGRVRGYVAAMVGTVLASWALAAVVLWGLERSGLWPPPLGWFPIAAVAGLQALILAISAILNGFQRLLISQVFELVVRPVLFLALVAPLMLLGQPVGPAGAFWLGGASMLAVLPFMGALTWRTMRGHIPQPVPARETLAGAWFVAALPLLMSNFTLQLQSNLGLLMIGSVLDDASAGAYRAASRLVDLVSIVNAIAVAVLGPMLARALAQGERERAQRLVAESSLLSAGLGWGLCVVLAVGAGPYLDLFGPGFDAGIGATYILLGAWALSLVTGPAAIALVVTGRERGVLASTLAGLAVNAGLNLLLIPRLGMEGAAIGTAMGQITLRGLQLAQALWSGSLDPTPFGLARRLGWRPRG